MSASTGPVPVTVLVVDDSAVQRRFLRAALEVAGGEFAVVGEARNGREAVALAERLRPGAIVMDLDLPVMSGLDAIERIMSVHPAPILVYSAFVGGQRSQNARDALAAGAVDVLAKPGPEDLGPLEQHATALRLAVRVAARVRVITHPRGRLRQQLVGQPVVDGCAPSLDGGGRRPMATPVCATEDDRRGVSLVVIGASTGGPQALLTVLAGLPTDLCQAVLVVQHMAEGFISGLASWLDGLVPLPVVVGQSGRRLQPGTVTIAPSGANLLVQDDRLRVLCVPPDPGQFHVPGIDATFDSVARALGPRAIGVLLTGMGRDGAAGLLTMRGRGALTLGQDEASSTVYGMPAAAFALDAVERQLPLNEVAAAVLVAVGRVPA